MIRYGLIQIGFWSVCVFTLNHEEDIAWLLGITFGAPAMLVFLIPYMAAKAVQRKTMLGYHFSRNGTMVPLMGLGIILSFLTLQIHEWYYFAIPIALIGAGGFMAHSAFRHRFVQTASLTRKQS